MFWNELVCLPKWIPLAQVAFHFHEFNDDIFKIEDTKYFIVTTHNNPTLEDTAGGPFVSSLLWACSDGAVMRALRKEIEKDEKLILEPPVELLPSPEARTYSSILAGLKDGGVKGVFESAGYRITDGKFLHRCIDSALADYYFRSRKNKKDETPYAILWKLKKR